MRRLDVVTRFIFALGFSAALTAAVFVSSSLGAQLPVAAAAGATSLPAAPGDTYCVAVISTTYSGCTRVFTNVQAAVDAASGLETIKVSQGTYTNVSSRPVPDGYVGLGGNITQALYLTKTVFIQGGYTTTNWTTPDPVAHPTTLDAQSQGRVVVIAGDITPTLTGMRLTGGDATNLGGLDGVPAPNDVGGGLYIISATATLSNSWVFSNTANNDPLLPVSEGGGLYLSSSPSIIYGNTIATNTAQFGGGLTTGLSDATISHNSIFGNLANDGGWGGGVYVEAGSVGLDHNTIVTNSASTGYGGGLAALFGTLTLSDNTIASNITDQSSIGGGVYLYFAIAGFTNNVIVDNIAGLGDGVYIAPVSNASFAHTTLANNTGGSGTGIYVESSSFTTVDLINTILVSHTVGVFADTSATVNLDSTLFGGGTNTSGTGTIINSHAYSGNPGFVNPSVGNYHLTSSSAALDVGIDAGVTTDLDGLPRPIGLGFDLGAYELYNPALSVSKSASSSLVLPGGVVTYTVRITNTGNVTLTTYLSDTLPTSVTFKGPVTVNPTGGSTGTPPALAGGQSIGIGKSVSVTFPVTLSTGAGMTAGVFITNTAAITSSPSTISAQPNNASTSIIIQNAVPIAVNDVYTMSGNTSASLNVLSNDSDPNGDALTITAVGSGVGINGVATISSGTTIIYTPTTDFVGTATFTYTVSDPGGLKSTASVQGNVLSVPISGLAAHNSSPTAYGVSTQFSATITTGSSITYVWNFGDGSLGSGASTSHTYATPGNYVATVTATNALPSMASATTAVTITKATPMVAITSDTPDPSVVGESVPIVFTVTPPGAFIPSGTVTVTDGTQSCTASVATGTCNIAFASPGSKTLTAQYGGDTFFSGASSAGTPHLVNKADTLTSISSIAPTPAFFGQSTAITVSLTITSPGAGTPTGMINITDGTVSCDASVPTPSTCNLTFNTLGTHIITATYPGDANFNASSTTSSIVVNDVPIAGLAAQGSSPTRLDDATLFTATITAGTNVNYTWDFGDGSPTGNGAAVSHVYAATGSYTATVTASNSANAPTANTMVVVTNQPPVAVALSDGVSPGTLATLDGSGSYDPDNHTPLEYFWTQTGGASVSFTPNLSVTTFTAPASSTVLTFSLTVTDAHGLASAPSQAVITVADLAITNLTAASSSPTVLGNVTAFTSTQTGGTGVSYAWDFGDGVGTGTGAHPTYTYPSVGTYLATVTATNVVNQLTRTTQVIVGLPVSGLTATSDSPRFVGSSTAFTATISAGTNAAYQWTFGDGGTGSGANPTHTYTAPGSYTAIVTATNVFGSQVATTTVTSLAQASLSLIATDTPDPASVGKALVYTVVVHNAGPTSADNVVVTDTLPTGVTFGSAVSTQGTCTTPTVTCNIGTLVNGGTVTVTITTTPSMSITSPVVVTNRAGVSSSTADTTLADNLATITTTIYPRRIFLPIVRR